MRAILLWFIIIMLSGCATTEPTVRTVTQVVKVPVPCEPPPLTKPTWVVDGLPLSADVDAQMRALRADRHRAKGYIDELEASRLSCQ